MANLFEQEEARLRERRERAREQERREQRLAELRAKAREEDREREREEQRRLDTLEQARQDAAAQLRKAARHAEVVARLRARRQAEREAADRAAQQQTGRLHAARRATVADHARADRTRQREQARRAQTREQHGAVRREQAREQQRDEARRELAQEKARDQQRGEAREAARGEDRARARQRARREESAADRRRQDRDQQARPRRRPPVAAVNRGLTRLRVHGPLLLDETDRPVRLRAIHIAGFDHAGPLPDRGYPPPVSDEELDLLVRWGATAVSVPIALDQAVAAAAVPDPLVVLPAGATPALDEADTGGFGGDYLDALDTTVRAAQDRGLYTIVQLATLRSGDDDGPLAFDACRLLWRTLGRRWRDSPAVLFELLRAPVEVDVAGVGPGSAVVAARQLHTLQLAMLGELRAENPAAVAIAGFVAGTVGAAPLTFTDGRPAPGVITGYRPGPLAQVPPELIGLARRVPVAVLGWSTGDDRYPNDAAGRRLAASGLHWVAEGWPATGTLVPGRAPVATAAGRAVATALAAQSDTAAPGPPAASLPPAAVPAGGGGGLAHRLLMQMLLGAAPAPLPRVIGPGTAASAYLPTADGLRRQLQPLSQADRARRIVDELTPVVADWQSATADGSLAMLARVRPAEKTAPTSAPRVPADLPGAVPKYLRQDLDLDASTGAAVGQALLTGAITVADAARGALTASQAIVGLRRVQDVLFRLRAARAAAAATGAPTELVLAIYRTEGALGLPPSADSIDRGVPSGTTDAATSLKPRPDISQLVWLVGAAPFTGYADPAIAAFATRSYVLHLTGLDVLGDVPPGGTAYVNWTLLTWQAAGVDNLGTALARAVSLRDAVTLRRISPPAPAAPAIAATVRNPVALVTTVLSDAVQLLRTFTRPDWLLGPPPLPAGAPAAIDLPLAYLRYNIGTDQVRLLLASAVIAAAGTTGPRWQALRTRIAAAPGLRSTLVSILRAAGPLTTDTQKAATATAVWGVLLPWCLTPGGLDALATFVYEATGAQWSSGWQAPRANVARFRLLRHYYGLVINP